MLYNGKVFTADEDFSIAEAVVIDGERIVAVGTSKELRSKYRAAKELNLQGRLVTPGFNDAHVHFLRGAVALLNVNLVGVKTLADAKEMVAAKAKRKRNPASGSSAAAGTIRFGTANFRRGRISTSLRRTIPFSWCASTGTSAGQHEGDRTRGIGGSTKSPERRRDRTRRVGRGYPAFLRKRRRVWSTG
ncbi:MAG: amidohydrolase family protein [Acidobacteria bacterium]|nr:amidohydrolase family protein [Acidobacteriota bacterium]